MDNKYSSMRTLALKGLSVKDVIAATLENVDINGNTMTITVDGKTVELTVEETMVLMAHIVSSKDVIEIWEGTVPLW